MKISGIILGAIAFGLLVIPIFASQDIYFLNSGSGSGNVTLAFDDLTDVVIFNAISGQIVVYNGTYWNNVNATTFSDTTTCNNLGSGTFICAGDNVNLKSLKASLGLSISNDSTSITYRTNFANGTGISITGTGQQTFTNTAPDNTTCLSVGSFAEVYKDGECNFRDIKGSADISVVQGTNDITIDYNGTLASESTVCSGQSGNYNIVASSSGGNCTFKNLDFGAGITLSSNGTHIKITNSLPEATSCSNVGTGSKILKTTAEDCVANSLLGGGGIGITNTTDDWTINYECLSTGGGTFSLCSFAGSSSIRSTSSGVGINITNSANNLIYKTNFVNGSGIQITGTTAQTFTNTKPELQIGQLTFITTEDKTMTNLSTGYVDVYATLWDQEEQAVIHGANVTYVRIYLQYDFVGAGTDQCRVVDVSNNANIVWESATFAVDQNSLDSGWVARPAFLSVDKSIELQCKSSNGTNDPIIRGYEVFIK